MDLKRVSVSDMDNNCYLLFCKGEGLLIDAADDAPRLLGLAAECGVRITKVVTTHAHWDHVRALGEGRCIMRRRWMRRSCRVGWM